MGYKYIFLNVGKFINTSLKQISRQLSTLLSFNNSSHHNSDQKKDHIINASTINRDCTQCTLIIKTIKPKNKKNDTNHTYKSKKHKS